MKWNAEALQISYGMSVALAIPLEFAKSSGPTPSRSASISVLQSSCHQRYLPWNRLTDHYYNLKWWLINQFSEVIQWNTWRGPGKSRGNALTWVSPVLHVVESLGSCWMNLCFSPHPASGWAEPTEPPGARGPLLCSLTYPTPILPAAFSALSSS